MPLLNYYCSHAPTITRVSSYNLYHLNRNYELINYLLNIMPLPYHLYVNPFGISHKILYHLLTHNSHRIISWSYHIIKTQYQLLMNHLLPNPKMMQSHNLCNKGTTCNHLMLVVQFICLCHRLIICHDYLSLNLFVILIILLLSILSAILSLLDLLVPYNLSYSFFIFFIKIL